MLSLDQKRAFGNKQVFLDGRPARVIGFKEQFATVYRLDAHHIAVQFSWAAVKRGIEQRGGYFAT